MMKYLKSCQLCHANDKKDRVSIGKRVIYQGNYNYIAVDISPLSLGHLLIITNEHYFNYYETPKNVKKEANQLKRKIEKVFREVYHSDTLFFEHGSSKPNEAGSSVDHAHLHAIPCSLYLEEELDVLGKPIECDIFLEQFFNEFSYIYLENSKNKYIYNVTKLPSQYLRKLVGEKLGNAHYDWRVYCKTEYSLQILEQTYLDLKEKIK